MHHLLSPLTSAARSTVHHSASSCLIVSPPHRPTGGATQPAPPDPLVWRVDALPATPSIPVLWPGIDLSNSGSRPATSTSISLSESTTRPVRNRLSMRGLTPAQRAAEAIVIVLISISRQFLQRGRRESPRSEDRPPSPRIIVIHRLKPASAARRSSSARNPAPSAVPAP